MNYQIRAIRPSEYSLLNDFLYEAIFVPVGTQPPPRSILQKPELQVYVAGFGTEKDDHALVAEYDGRIVGAVWVRVMEDYGHVEDGIPSFALSLYPGYRSQGIGTALMTQMLNLLKEKGYPKASLAVQKANYAVNLYRKVGFVVINENEEEFIMVCNLNPCPEKQLL